MLKNALNSLKNPKILTAVVSGIVMILVNTGVISLDVSEKAMEVFNTLLGIGIAIGVFTNPEPQASEATDGETMH